MTDTKEQPSESTTTDRETFKLSDDVIGMIRELIQLSLLTGTNIVDHLRSLIVEKAENDQRYITVCPEYIEAYNQMIEKLNSDAEQAMLEQVKQQQSEDEADDIN